MVAFVKEELERLSQNSQSLRRNISMESLQERLNEESLFSASSESSPVAPLPTMPFCCCSPSLRQDSLHSTTSTPSNSAERHQQELLAILDSALELLDDDEDLFHEG